MRSRNSAKDRGCVASASWRSSAMLGSLEVIRVNAVDAFSAPNRKIQVAASAHKC